MNISKETKQFIKKLPGAIETKACIESLSRNITRIQKMNSFKRDFKKFKNISNNMDNRFSINWSDRFPCLTEDTENSGFDRSYIYHTAWAARILAQIKPDKHTDISSHIQFVTLVSAFIPFDFFDYRPAEIDLSNLNTGAADLINLPFEDKSISSLSCMHVVEHIGLGRYGDPIDPNGDMKACNELNRVVANGGSLLFVVPVGKPKIQFNAHRIYNYEQVISMFPDLSIKQFFLITDNDALFDASPETVMEIDYGCGCFWFQR